MSVCHMLVFVKGQLKNLYKKHHIIPRILQVNVISKYLLFKHFICKWVFITFQFLLYSIPNFHPLKSTSLIKNPQLHRTKKFHPRTGWPSRSWIPLPWPKQENLELIRPTGRFPGMFCWRYRNPPPEDYRYVWRLCLCLVEIIHVFFQAKSCFFVAQPS